jgi:hypothetical protein
MYVVIIMNQNEQLFPVFLEKGDSDDEKTASTLLEQALN